MKKIQILGWSEKADSDFIEVRNEYGLEFPFEIIDKFDELDNGGQGPNYLAIIPTQVGNKLMSLYYFNYKIVEENYNIPPQFPTELYLLVLADDDFYDHTVYSNMGFYITKEEAEETGKGLLDPDYKERMIVQKWIWDGTKYKIETDEKV